MGASRACAGPRPGGCFCLVADTPGRVFPRGSCAPLWFPCCYCSVPRCCCDTLRYFLETREGEELRPLLRFHGAQSSRPLFSLFFSFARQKVFETVRRRHSCITEVLSTAPWTHQQISSLSRPWYVVTSFPQTFALTTRGCFTF